MRVPRIDIITTTRTPLCKKTKDPQVSPKYNIIPILFSGLKRSALKISECLWSDLESLILFFPDRSFLPSKLPQFLRATFRQFRHETSRENLRRAEITPKDCRGDRRLELATVSESRG